MTAGVGAASILGGAMARQVISEAGLYSTGLSRPNCFVLAIATFARLLSNTEELVLAEHLSARVICREGGQIRGSATSRSALMDALAAAIVVLLCLKMSCLITHTRRMATIIVGVSDLGPIACGSGRDSEKAEVRRSYLSERGAATM